jgi:hypothetical protein
MSAHPTHHLAILRLPLLLAGVASLALTSCGGERSDGSAIQAAATVSESPSPGPSLEVVDRGEAPRDGLDFGGVIIRAGATTQISRDEIESLLERTGDLSVIAQGVETAGGRIEHVDMWTGLLSDMNVRVVDDDPLMPSPPPTGGDVPVSPGVVPIRDKAAVLLVFPSVPWAGVTGGPPRYDGATTVSVSQWGLRDVLVALDAETGEFLFLRTVDVAVSGER